MPTAAELDQVRRALNQLSASAQGDLQRLWSSFRTSDRMLVSRALTEGWVALVEKYGEMAAEIGADRFDQWATELGIRSRLQVAPGVNPERATSRLGWALSTQNQLGNARVLTDELVKQPYRSTLQDSAFASGAGWARVPTGAETCAFCLMLASRGGVYHTRELARLGTSGKKYHGDCDCQPVPILRSGARMPDGYNPDGLYDQYRQARKDADSGDPKQILSAMRERFDLN